MIKTSIIISSLFYIHLNYTYIINEYLRVKGKECLIGCDVIVGQDLQSNYLMEGSR
jgi:hypothetical protein